MKVSYKVSCWQAFEIEDKYKDDLLAFLKENPKASADEIYYWYYFKLGDALGPVIDLIEGTEEELKVDENDGYSTIEITGDHDFEEVIYMNGN
jgi:hypothetical protein